MPFLSSPPASALQSGLRDAATPRNRRPLFLRLFRQAFILLSIALWAAVAYKSKRMLELDLLPFDTVPDEELRAFVHWLLQTLF